MKHDLRNFSLDEIEEVIAKYGVPKFRAGQLFSWIHKNGVDTYDEMKNIPNKIKDALAKKYEIGLLKEARVEEADDGTKKYLWELHDGHMIESVLLNDAGRKTICLSSQVGCKMDCLFCATAKLKFKRNLTVGEIISQVVQIEKANGKISNLVYMGMGEPLDNYANVLKSARILNHPKGKNIGVRKITVSTCGVVPKIKQLAKEGLDVTLAVSLNATDDKQRLKLMPVNKKHNIGELLAAVRAYIKTTGRRATIEYVMINKTNDSEKNALELAQLLHGMKVNVNLIAYNPIQFSAMKSPGNARIREFRKVLEDAGFDVTQRLRRGREISAACGQLLPFFYEKERQPKENEL